MRVKLEAGLAALAGGVGRVRISSLEGIKNLRRRNLTGIDTESSHMSSIMTTDPSLETLAPTVAGSPILGTYKRAPMEFVRGAGVELFDSAGKAYLDLASGIAVNALGYGDSGIRER